MDWFIEPSAEFKHYTFLLSIALLVLDLKALTEPHEAKSHGRLWSMPRPCLYIKADRCHSRLNCQRIQSQVPACETLSHFAIASSLSGLRKYRV